MTESLVEELNAIDRVAYRMAAAIVTKQQRREDLVSEISRLRPRFQEIVAQLKNTWPELYNARSEQISETALDLKFVAADQKMVSLRLNHLIQNQGAHNDTP